MLTWILARPSRPGSHRSRNLPAGCRGKPRRRTSFRNPAAQRLRRRRDRDGARMLKASTPTEFLVTLPEVLPADFTIEFDIVPKSCCSGTSPSREPPR